MSVAIVEFKDVPVGTEIFIQADRDWDCHRKVDATRAQRETALMHIPLGEPFAVKPSLKVKVVS